MKFEYIVTMPDRSPFTLVGERLDFNPQTGTSIIFDDCCGEVLVAVIPDGAVIIANELKQPQS